MNLRPQRTEREGYSLCDTSVAMRYQKVVGETKEKIREEDLLNVSGGHKIGSFKKKKKTEVSDEPYNPFDHLKEIFSGSDDSEEGGATGGW